MLVILLNSSKLIPRSSSFREIRLTMHKAIWGKKHKKKVTYLFLKKIAMEFTITQMSTE